MAQIGSLFVRLALNDASFVTDLKRATKETEKAAAGMSRALSGAKTALGAFTAAFSVGTIAAVSKQALDYAGSLGEISQQLGITTRELQVYRYAATQVGLSQEEIEKGLGKLTLEIGRNNAAFAELGITTRNADGSLKTAGQTLPELADALARIPDPAERARVLVELFGRTGQRMGTLLSGGASGLREFADQAERTGQVLSSKAIQDADRAADAIAKMQNVLRVSVAGAVAENAASIAALGEAIGGVVTRLGQLAAKVRDTNRLARAMEAARGDKSYLGGLVTTRGTGELNTGAFVRELLGQALEDAAPASLSAAAAGAGTGIGTGNSGASAVRRAARGGRSGPSAADRIAEARGEAFAETARSLTETASAAASVSSIRVDYEEIARIAQKIPTSKFADAMGKAADFSERLGDNLAQAILYSQNFGTAMLNSLKAIAAQEISSGLTSLFKTAFSSLKLDGARADGGPVRAGGRYLVGERGPEIVEFPRAGRVIPNHAIGMGGGPTEIIVRTEPSPLFAQTVLAISQQSGAQAAGGVIRQARRGRMPGSRG